MDDSLKYGIPAGILAYGLFWIFPDPFAKAWVRWLIVALTTLPTALWFIRAKNRAHFPFSFAFLSAFNLSIAVVLVQGLLLTFLGADWLPAKPTAETDDFKWILFIVFQESIGFFFVLLLFTLMLSAIFMRKK